MELKFWQAVCGLILSSFKEVNFEYLAEDIKVVKSMYEPHAAAEALIWGHVAKSYVATKDTKVIEMELILLQLNSGLYKPVSLSL